MSRTKIRVTEFSDEKSDTWKVNQYHDLDFNSVEVYFYRNRQFCGHVTKNYPMSDDRVREVVCLLNGAIER